MRYGNTAPAPIGIAIGAGAVLLFLSGCGSGPSASAKKKLDSMMAQQNFAGAESFVDSMKEGKYGKKNMVLFYLDKGLIEHHEGKFKESDESFNTAEQRMDELFTKSVTKTAGMLLLNDNTVDYAGEPYERTLTNVFRALNYVSLGQLDEALVESRKVELFLQQLNDKLGGKDVYKDDAFARYLDSMLYADEGQADDARISMDAAKAAYSWYAKDYNTTAPNFVLADDPSQGELVFIHYNGVAPIKESKTFQVAWGEGVAMVRQSDDPQKQQFENGMRAGVLGNAITVAYPEYRQEHFDIQSSEVNVDGLVGNSLLMEDVTAIAMKTLRDRNALIRTRAVARATIKYVLAAAITKAAADRCARQYGAGSWQCRLEVGATRLVTQGTAAATEVADTRSWSTLPSQIRMARLKLPPGKHDVTVNFKDGAGRILATHLFKDVEISKSKRTYLSYRTAL